MTTQTAGKVGQLKGAVCSMEKATRERRKRLENRKGRKTSLKRTTEKRQKGEDGERKERKWGSTHKGFWFGPVPWWGVVWKEERLWQGNTAPTNALLSFTFILHFTVFLFLLNLLLFLSFCANTSLTTRHLCPCKNCTHGCTRTLCSVLDTRFSFFFFFCGVS